MRNAALAVLVATVCLSTAARADEPAVQIEEKSPAVAVGLSVGATLAGYALLANAHDRGVGELGAALVFAGPSAGEWYVGKVGAIGMGVRSVGLLAMLYGIIGVSAVAVCNDCSRGAVTPDHGHAAAALAVGATLWIGGTLLDWYEAYHEANAYNDRQRAIARQFAPTMLPTPSGGMAPGMAFSARF